VVKVMRARLAAMATMMGQITAGSARVIATSMATSSAARPMHPAALVVMPLLALAKRRIGQQLGNQALIADAAESAFCASTLAAALLGIGLSGRW
jgi:divalent metal cation (Fe/Co/Zn/Cd) transporter